MAEVLDEFPEKKLNGNRKYPWEKWMDGSIWKAKRNEDYTITSQKFAYRLSAKAKFVSLHGSHNVKVNFLYTNEEVVFQFYKEEDE